MKSKSFTLSLTQHQLGSLQVLFQNCGMFEFYASQQRTLDERVTGLVLIKLYHDRLIQKFTFPQHINKVKLSTIESHALLAALLAVPRPSETFDRIQLQQITNQLHQHTS